MPAEPREEDLFKDSTMSFGEHLEELRKALFKSVFGLLIGLLFGLAIANHVVKFVQIPLEGALRRYYKEDAQKTADAKIQDQLGKLGLPNADHESIRQHISDGLLPQLVWIEREQLVKELGLAEASKANGAERPEPTGASVPAGLVPMLTYRTLDDDPRIQARSLGPVEPFWIWLKAALLVGAVLSSPWVFYQIWEFVAAGLYPHEKHYVHLYLPFSVGLFIGGALLAFFFAMQPVLDFLLSFNQWMGIAPDLRITEWLSFVLFLPLGFGISFQLPLVMLFLERIGIFSIESYLSRWRVSVLVIFVIAMVCTPGDPTSMLLMAVALTFLYFGGILLCRYLPKAARRFDDLDEQYA